MKYESRFLRMKIGNTYNLDRYFYFWLAKNKPVRQKQNKRGSSRFPPCPPSQWNFLLVILCSKFVFLWHLRGTVGEKKDWTKRDFWSKTTLITSGVSGTWVNPPFCKITMFFHRSLALSMPIYRNFQSNGANWRSIKCWTKIFI